MSPGTLASSGSTSDLENAAWSRSPEHAECGRLSAVPTDPSSFRQEFYLVTNLRRHRFLEEITLTEAPWLGVIPKTSMLIRADEHMNAVFEAAGKPTLAVHLRAADVDTQTGPYLQDGERQVLSALREGDFDRLVVEPAHGGYHMVLDRNRTERDLEAVKRILDESGYQSVTVKKVDGRIVRLRQEESRVVKSPMQRSEKSRPAKGESSEKLS